MKFTIEAKALLAVNHMTGLANGDVGLQHVQVAMIPEVNLANPVVAATNGYAVCYVEDAVKCLDESFPVNKAYIHNEWISTNVKSSVGPVLFDYNDRTKTCDEDGRSAQKSFDRFPDWVASLPHEFGHEHDRQQPFCLELLELGWKSLRELHGGYRQWRPNRGNNYREAMAVYYGHNEPLVIKTAANGMKATVVMMPLRRRQREQL